MKTRHELSRSFIGGVSMAITMLSLQACGGAEDICGPCGSLESGQLSIAGNAQIDGFFAATHRFQGATAQIKTDFDADIRALAEVWGYGEAGAEIDAAFVAGLVGHIKAEINDSIDADAGLKVTIVPAKCEASVDVAVEAQASCEVQADCEVEVDPGQASVACEGTCSGSCSGSCSGDLSCAVKTPTVNCEGQCEGSCAIEGTAACEGTCRGTCDGTCSATDANGQCAGTCDGSCAGTCEITTRASCQGECNGTCYVEQGSAQCTAEAECAGSCDAECSGKCEGNFEPPSASADCEASADCQAQAKAQANASLECTPPQIDITFAFHADLLADPELAAEFTTKMTELKTRGAAILQGAAKLSALVTGEVNGEVVFSPSPLADLSAQMGGLVSAGVEGEYDIPIGRLPCVIPALAEAVDVLADASTDLTGVIQAQVEFAAVFNP
jgi:modification target Cys-rich repeat protein